jgi:hypothetical protein
MGRDANATFFQVARSIVCAPNQALHLTETP